MNWWIFFPTALIPLVIGAIYYSPALAGKAWMATNNFTEDDLKGGNMAVTLGIAYLLSLFITSALAVMVVHQFSVGSSMMATEGFGEAGSIVTQDLEAFMAKYGDNHRSFGHGALHGVIAAIFFASAVIGVNAVFEKRSFKYWLIHAGYWIITLALVGGVLGQFITLPS